VQLQVKNMRCSQSILYKPSNLEDNHLLPLNLSFLLCKMGVRRITTW
jgi:hypothetical protein